MSGAQAATAHESGEGLCATCAAPLRGKFCAACGEKLVDPHEYSIGHFAEHALESFTHFDFKSFRTLKFLVFRPGFLSREYLDGRRRPHVNPLQLFVIVNLLFAALIGLSGWTPLNTPMNIQRNIGPFREWKRSVLDARMSHSNQTPQGFERSFNAAASTASKTWIFSMIPLFAGLSAALYGFRRYFFGHLIFATHFYTFVLVYFLVATHISTLVLSGLGFFNIRFDVNDIDNTVSLIMLAVVAWYLYKALRRTYQDSRLFALARSLALTVVFFPILFLYRLLLFYVTIQAMH